MFSIVIPTWNNLEYLKLCIDSIRRHSMYDHEILIHVNEGSDGTLEWVKKSGLKFTYSERNLGVCLSTNIISALASRDWLLYLNDDMICCPGWDAALVTAAESKKTDLALFFSRLIEPMDTGNPLVLVDNFGQKPEEFDEGRMLERYDKNKKADMWGMGSQPTLVRRKWWHAVGGYSIEFSPGMSSDDDLLMKFWVLGCRDYHLIDASRVYHFACRSTGRVRRNRGGRAFVMKWGITQASFKKDYLRKWNGENAGLQSFPAGGTKSKLKRLAYSMSGYPLDDLRLWDASPGKGLTTEDGTPHFARTDVPDQNDP